MKKLYNLLFILLAATISLQLNAQTKKIQDIDAFKQKVNKVASSIKTIECDFVQTKHMEIFNEDIISSGKFYYQNEDKICLDYLKPAKYIIVINGNKIKTVTDGKKNIVNLKSNKVMKEMRSMLTACMSGNITQISGYKMEFFEDNKFYLIKIIPTSQDVKGYISQFDVYMDKNDMSVSKLRITEKGDNYTDYQFKNKKFNQLTNENVFSVN